MNRNKVCAAIIAISFATGATPAAAAGKKENPVQRMSTASSDGDKSYYTVWCTNKSIGSVIAEHDKQRYCALPLNGKRKCNKEWGLKTAAKQACKTGK